MNAGHEIGQLDPGVRRGEDLRGGPLAVQDLRPVPLAAVGAAALGQVAVARSGGLLGDLGGLGVAGVVLPQPGMGGQVLAELRLQGQRHAVAIHRHGGRAGGVHADADHVLRPRSRAAFWPPPPPGEPSDKNPRCNRPGFAGRGWGPSGPAGCPPRRWDSRTRRWRLRCRRPRRPPTPARCWCRNPRRSHIFVSRV